MTKALDLLVEYLNNSNSSGISIKGRGVSKLHDFLTVAFSEGVRDCDLRLTITAFSIFQLIHLYFAFAEICTKCIFVKRRRKMVERE